MYRSLRALDFTKANLASSANEFHKEVQSLATPVNPEHAFDTCLALKDSTTVNATDPVVVRNFLNHLVLKSMQKKNPGRQVSYFKTHKTASSTSASIFYRFNARHHLRMWQSPHIATPSTFFNETEDGKFEPPYPVGAVPNCHDKENLNDGRILWATRWKIGMIASGGKCLEATPYGALIMAECEEGKQEQNFRKHQGHIRTADDRCVLLENNVGPGIVLKDCALVGEWRGATVESLGRENHIKWKREGSEDLCLTRSNTHHGQGFFHHLTPSGIFRGNWREIFQMLRSTAPEASLVTNFRDTVSHYKSWYHYYQGRKTKMPLKELLAETTGDRIPQNTLAMEFGLYTEKDMETFLAEKALGQFAMILQAEHFDEGLVVMRKLFGWDMIDITYTSLNTNQHVAYKKTTEDHALDKKIEKYTKLDKALYDAGMAHYRGSKRRAGDISDDILEFKCLQDVIRNFCSGTEQDGQESDGCRWYQMHDFENEESIGYDGFARPYLF